ncbi:kaz1-ORFB [Haematobia irritans]|uniref:kaz1-ORFB n=1 Tax=Haematobia irritans TaxID=7368 RepID=UPI003F508C80
MKPILIIFGILSIIIGQALGRPQFQNRFQGPVQQFPGNPFLPSNNNQVNGGGNNFFQLPATPATTAAPNTPTTASPQYLACLQGCPSTMEYNPICGTDNINYHNNGRLTCAQRCGKNVSALRAGTCSPL